MNTQKSSSLFINPWTRKPQEQEGDYLFAGMAVMTSGIQEACEQHDVLAIVHDLRKSVKEHAGLDYLQVFTHTDGRKVWVIDNLSKDRLESDGMTDAEKQEHNYFTILLPEEY